MARGAVEELPSVGGRAAPSGQASQAQKSSHGRLFLRMVSEQFFVFTGGIDDILLPLEEISGAQ